MKRIIFLLCLFTSAHVMAQTDTSSIVVHKDPRIDLLVKKQIEINEVTTRNARRFVPGFRILVVNTNDRNKAMNAKSRLYQEMPELQVYLMYQAPFYKLKAGNFKDRKEADDYLPTIQRLFPTGVYVVRDTIEVNPDPSAN
ncbi:SPOR domain-containing protein [Paraflavitalea sp. CAU 1676]|uniref:SPOR domain-containing protein n=1 Tax=Paraflavitalea sp. CAU 1676 TaxID=3032598 RepID=UPI0023DC77EF|nr:SPOR domain-containing protein [Paraflavitalea sp. CAU 1676]MDF2189419.1 SPOR domain-containing protein [Paraflavitalea sp. CAU 1676]